MKYLEEFFWWCAGANIEILRKYPTDHAKYFGVGGTIVFTALMACFAGGYAFFTAFKSVWLSIFFGIFWGLLIFNLDRYIVATIKDDGTSKITLDEWKMAFPRLLMAVLLGFVIATPLELRIFDTEIKTEIEVLKEEEAIAITTLDSTNIKELEKVRLDLSHLSPQISDYNKNKSLLANNAGLFFEEAISNKKQDLGEINKGLSVAQSKVNSAYSKYLKVQKDTVANEVERTKLYQSYRALLPNRDRLRSSKKKLEDEILEMQNNRGSAIQKEVNRIEAELASLVNRRQSLENREEELVSRINTGKSLAASKTENYNGFGAHLEAMQRLTDKKKSIRNSKWLITLLFIFIEIAPVLFKLMTESGPYDEEVKRRRHSFALAERKIISDLNEEVATDLKIVSEKNRNRLATEVSANQDLMKKIAQAQTEIAEAAVEKWKKEELSKIESGIGHIINVQTSQE